MMLFLILLLRFRRKQRIYGNVQSIDETDFHREKNSVSLKSFLIYFCRDNNFQHRSSLGTSGYVAKRTTFIIIDLRHRNLCYLRSMKEKRAGGRAFFICRHIPVIFFDTSPIDAITRARLGLMCSTSRISPSFSSQYFEADEMKVELMRLYPNHVCRR